MSEERIYSTLTDDSCVSHFCRNGRHGVTYEKGCQGRSFFPLDRSLRVSCGPHLSHLSVLVVGTLYCGTPASQSGLKGSAYASHDPGETAGLSPHKCPVIPQHVVDNLEHLPCNRNPCSVFAMLVADACIHPP